MAVGTAYLCSLTISAAQQTRSLPEDFSGLPIRYKQPLYRIAMNFDKEKLEAGIFVAIVAYFPFIPFSYLPLCLDLLRVYNTKIIPYNVNNLSCWQTLFQAPPVCSCSKNKAPPQLLIRTFSPSKSGPLMSSSPTN